MRKEGREKVSPLRWDNEDNNVWCTALTSIGQLEMFFIPKIAGSFKQNNSVKDLKFSSRRANIGPTQFVHTDQDFVLWLMWTLQGSP